MNKFDKQIVGWLEQDMFGALTGQCSWFYQHPSGIAKATGRSTSATQRACRSLCRAGILEKQHIGENRIGYRFVPESERGE